MEDYLERLKGMKRKKVVDEDYKQGYKQTIHAIKNPRDLGKDKKLLETGKNFVKYFNGEKKSPSDWRKGNSSKIASELMTRGIKNRNLEYSLVGLKLYDCIGLADRDSVKRKFERAAKLNPNPKYLNQGIEIFEKYKNDFGIEQKVLGFLSVAFFLAGISFLSLNLTGNVIGNMTRSSGNILGIILFVLGIVGLFLVIKE
ncbi:hypothetical protein KBC25_01635 [Candidatus Pacearchaeota archaeon]|jgi:hypothetical protein|nr:hypothetical protein [Candidatus Pacearchaeota archaeon]HOC96961.1 hypothetical protein [Candidatus Pacearchaeota archaeon]HOH04504.1 hypothetical protein [Candidatus Pacearchaeota archaeon]